MVDNGDDTALLAGENRELERVFKRLCNFAAKSKQMKILTPKQKRITKIQLHKKRPDAVKIVNAEGNVMSEEDIDRELERLQKDVEEIQANVDRLNEINDKKIKLQDLNAALKRLGMKMKKSELENMIWEVDENLDGCVDWEEFKLMYERNVTDKTGLEPFQLFNVVQFMMYDKDNSGTVSIDETMTMLYQRYGKERLETEMKKLFGDDLKSEDGDGELSFGEYLRAVSVRLPKVSKIEYKTKKR